MSFMGANAGGGGFSAPWSMFLHTLSLTVYSRVFCRSHQQQQQQPPRPTSVTIRRPFKCACLCCCRPYLHVMDAADNVIGEVHNPYVTHKCSTPYRAPRACANNALLTTSVASSSSLNCLSPRFMCCNYKVTARAPITDMEGKTMLPEIEKDGKNADW